MNLLRETQRAIFAICTMGASELIGLST